MKGNDILNTLCRLFNSISDTSEVIDRHISDIRKVNKSEKIAPRNVIELISKLNEATNNNAKVAANELFWTIMAKRKQQAEQGPGE